MITAKNLTKRYNHFTALRNINLSTGVNSIIGLLGPNGAGKTTFMRILTGFMPATEGTISVDGIDVHTDPIKVKQITGYLPEKPPLYDELTVKEYLSFCADLKGVPKSKKQKRLDYVYQACGLTKRLNQIIGTLSKGYKQRTGLAMAIVNDPGLLVLDEPTVGLDPNQIIEIRNLITDLARDRTVILSSHILQEISTTCNHIIIINDGSIIADRSKSDLIGSMEDNRVLVKLRSNPDHAKIVLKQFFEHVESNADTLIIRDSQIEKKQHKIAEILITNQVEVLEITRKQRTLEEIFHQITLN